jgi:hypothetical protein
MASADYSEDNNIQEPAAKLFEDNLDWRSVYAFNAETFGPHRCWAERTRPRWCWSASWMLRSPS